MPLSRPDQQAALGACPLFRSLDDAGLAAVADAVVEVDFPAGRVIAREGEIGTGLFVITAGQVRVVKAGTTIAELGPGQFFGELSVLDGAPRNASVVAATPVSCLALATWDAERVLREQPGVALAVLRELAGRLRAATDDLRT